MQYKPVKDVNKHFRVFVVVLAYLYTLCKIENSHPNCGILLVGDFNRLDVSQITNPFRLKLLVNFATRGDNIL